jgi:hypothetical protein
MLITLVPMIIWITSFMFNLIIIYKGEWKTLWWEWWNIVGAVECDSGGAVDEGVVNLCGGERVTGWMWYNIWREKGRWESGLASARCRLYRYSEILRASCSCPGVTVLLGPIGLSPCLLPYACLAFDRQKKIPSKAYIASIINQERKWS